MFYPVRHGPIRAVEMGKTPELYFTPNRFHHLENENKIPFLVKTSTFRHMLYPSSARPDLLGRSW